MKNNCLFSFSRQELGRLKGIGILLVLLGHLQHIVWGGAPGVALFLIASGYGIHESYCESGLKGYWPKRLKKVYLPYVLVAVINILAQWPCGKRRALVTLLGLDFGSNLDPTMWYISFIFIWYAVFYVIFEFIGKRPWNLYIKNLIELALLFAASFFCRALKDTVIHADSGMAVYVCFFPLGVGMSMCNRLTAEKGINKFQTELWTCVLILCAAYQLRVYGGQSYSALFAGTMACLFIAAGKLVSLPERIGSALEWLGKYSYGIYLVEGLILYKKALWFRALEIKYLMDMAFLATSVIAGYFLWNGLYMNVLQILSNRKCVSGIESQSE